MKTINKIVEFSSKIPLEQLNKVQLDLHHAVQLIAAAGIFLLEKQDDDSHTNMSWDAKTETFYGGSINKRARVGFHVPSFSLKVSGPTGIELASLPLAGKTKEESIIWLQQALQLKQIDTTSLELKTHYEIPDHYTDQGVAFSGPDKMVLKELAKHRNNADHICSKVFSENPKASPPRTWPHHFDHGVYVPLEFDENSEPTRSFSIGYAVADGIVNEPYFYVTQWQKDNDIDYSNVTELEFGSWMPKELKGAALRVSEIFDMDDQEKGIKDFLDVTIRFSKRF
jgi:hypothetical protein